MFIRLVFVLKVNSNEIFKFLGVDSEFSNAIGQFIVGHLVFIQHPTECLLIQSIVFLVDDLGTLLLTQIDMKLPVVRDSLSGEFVEQFRTDRQ